MLAYLASKAGRMSRQPRSSRRKCWPRAPAATECQISSTALNLSARYAAGWCVRRPEEGHPSPSVPGWPQIWKHRERTSPSVSVADVHPRVVCQLRRRPRDGRVCRTEDRNVFGVLGQSVVTATDHINATSTDVYSVQIRGELWRLRTIQKCPASLDAEATEQWALVFHETKSPEHGFRGMAGNTCHM